MIYKFIFTSNFVKFCTIFKKNFLLKACDNHPNQIGLNLDSRSADKELKAVTPEKSEACVTAFTKKLVSVNQNQKWSYLVEFVKMYKIFNTLK